MKVQPQNLIGIEFGARKVSLVRATAGGKLIRAGAAAMPNGEAVFPPADFDGDADEHNFTLLSCIRRAARNAGFKRISGLKCSVCVSGPDIILRRFQIPYMEKDALRMNAAHEIQSYISLNPEDYYVDYKILSYYTSKEDDSLNLNVLVAAIETRKINMLTSALKKAGFNPVFADVAENAREKLINYVTETDLSEFDVEPELRRREAARVKRRKEKSELEKQRRRAQKADLYGMRRTDYKKPVASETEETAKPKETLNAAVLFIGEHHTDVTIILGKRFYISRWLNTGLRQIDEAISEVSGCIVAQAASLRANENYFDDDNNTPAASRVREVADSIISEISSVMDYSFYRERRNKVDRIYVTGPMTAMKGILPYLEESFAMPVRTLDDVIRQKFRITRKVKNFNSSSYLGALGSTLREVRK